MRRLAFIPLVCLLLFAGCVAQIDTPTVTAPEEVTAEQTAPTVAPPPPDPWTAEDIDAIARTLSGECYEDKPHDKRLVAEVILNRVSDGHWGDTVTAVVTAKSQFHGYWKPSRDISDNDRETAITALRDWHDNDQQALSEYLYFEAGPNRENTFRKNY